MRERAREFAALRGRTVHAWTGVEMAILEHPPRFTDPRVPCLQLLSLELLLDNDESLTVVTYQDDDTWGLWTQPPVEQSREWDGIYRARSLGDLPTGVIEKVTVFAADGVLVEVLLSVGSRQFLLVAGEAVEDWGDVNIAWRDESVLAFTDPAVADTITWHPPRQGLAPIGN